MKALSILQPNDIALFESMRGNYASENEQKFFEQMEYIQQYVDMEQYWRLVNEDSNSEHIYIERSFYDWYIISSQDGAVAEEVCTLSALLSYKMSNFGYDITVKEWLRSMDYQCVVPYNI